MSNPQPPADSLEAIIAEMQAEFDAIHGVPCVKVDAVPCGKCVYCLLKRAERAEGILLELRRRHADDGHPSSGWKCLIGEEGDDHRCPDCMAIDALAVQAAQAPEGWQPPTLLAAAQLALKEMCDTIAPRDSFTDAVDALDAAIATTIATPPTAGTANQLHTGP